MIEVLQKPESVSWAEIHDVIYKAHESNRKNGVDIRNAYLSGEELKESLGSEGVCFVALDGDKVVATSSVAFHTLNTWYSRGQKVAYGTLSAVLPEYKGRHLFSRLEQARVDYARSKDCEGFYVNTAERNTKIRDIKKKYGYFEVAIGRTSFNPHNYITIYKWLGERPFPEYYIRLRFFYSWLKLKMKLALRRIK